MEYVSHCAMPASVFLCDLIYTTIIEEFVCPPNISETIAVRIMKLAHRPRIASTTIKLISKPIFLSILLKTIQWIGTGPKLKSLPPFVCLRWFGRLRWFPFRG